MLSATKAYICAALMTWLGTADTSTLPPWVSSIAKEKNSTVQWESLHIQLGKFVDEYVLTEFDIERAWRDQVEQQKQQKENQRSNVDFTQRSPDNVDGVNAQQPYSAGMSKKYCNHAII